MAKMNLSAYMLDIIQVENDVLVTIKDAREHSTSLGEKCIRVTFEDEDGRRAKHHFGQSEAALKVLASFAATCGLTRDEIKDFEPRMLVGKRLRVDFEENDQGFVFAKRWRKHRPPESIDGVQD